MDDRENGFPLFEREENSLIIWWRRRSGRKNQQQLWTLCQGLPQQHGPGVDSILNVESVDPHGGPGCTQVLGKAQRELGVFMNVAERKQAEIGFSDCIAIGSVGAGVQISLNK